MHRYPTVGWSDAPPVSGYWVAGDILYTTNPVSGGFTGFICTASGAPGTWTTLPEVIS